MATRTATRKASPVRISHAGGMDVGRRPDIEDDLTNVYHVTWTYLPRVKLSEIDTEKSRHNQARFEPIDEKVVATYVEAMKRDEHFPPLIVYRPSKGSGYVIIDGEGMGCRPARPSGSPRPSTSMTTALQ